MADPRPFGTGYYGTGYYSRYRGTIWDAAGASSLQLTTQGTAQLLFDPAGFVELQFAAWTWGIQRSRAIAGRTQIQLSAWSKGIQRIINPQAYTEIRFSAWALHFSLSWQLPAPCIPGEWTPAEPCETGVWSLPGGAAAGSWPLTAPCEPGVWAKPPGGASGMWEPVRLPGP